MTYYIAIYYIKDGLIMERRENSSVLMRCGWGLCECWWGIFLRVFFIATHSIFPLFMGYVTHRVTLGLH